MNEQNDILNYLNNLFFDFTNNCISLGYDNLNFTELFYKHLISEDSDFSEFACNYINYDDFSDDDIKYLFKKYMYATYYIQKNCNEITTAKYDEICTMMINYKYNNLCFEQTFFEDDFGIQLIESLCDYIDSGKVKKKKMAVLLENDPNFYKVIKNNDFLKLIYLQDRNLKVTEEEVIIDDVLESYDNKICEDAQYFNSNCSLEDLQNSDLESDKYLTKVKKELFLKSLLIDINSKRNIQYIKHVFSIILKNVYTEIFFSKINDIRSIHNNDEKFCELINSNKMTFEELFDLFIKNNYFANYLIGIFYYGNVDCDDLELEERNDFFEEKNLNDKIKKYYID